MHMHYYVFEKGTASEYCAIKNVITSACKMLKEIEILPYFQNDPILK